MYNKSSRVLNPCAPLHPCTSTHIDAIWTGGVYGTVPVQQQAAKFAVVYDSQGWIIVGSIIHP